MAPKELCNFVKKIPVYGYIFFALRGLWLGGILHDQKKPFTSFRKQIRSELLYYCSIVKISLPATVELICRKNI